MNPARHATTPAERIARARMIARTLPVPAVAGYLRRHELPRVEHLQIALALRDSRGISAAATLMRSLGWTIEAALLTLIGACALERYLNREVFNV